METGISTTLNSTISLGALISKAVFMTLIGLILEMPRNIIINLP